MSGTSLDGIDAAMVAFDAEHPTGILIDQQYHEYPAALRLQILDLHDTGNNELHRAALIANELADRYAETVNTLMARTNIHPIAIACHGQTIRHRPEAGYTIQLVNAARLAEHTRTTVIADFRNRDIAAGGQGAPLVPAFHAAAFRHMQQHRVIVNIGGIANLTDLPISGDILGFDCGPGNTLLDAWCLLHTGQAFDRDGAWSAQGKVIPALLAKYLNHPYFMLPAPKSAGREQFNLAWVMSQLQGNELPQDVQATLLQLTALSIANAITRYCTEASEIFICGGGAHNGALLNALCSHLPRQRIALTDALGIHADWLEAHAFAWLGWQTLQGLPGNLIEATGATHPCILGAIYPA
ncbi:anhydro-N-acetylmuramic acid kinase [Sulfuriferula sp. AH1]|nr:anhydro-N-acetylmuramic acid kinase [Sulfuriferula sp. AH1]